MLVWGAGSPQDGPDTTGAAYDPTTNTWRQLPDAPASINYGQAAWTGNEMVVVGVQEGKDESAIALSYSPVGDSWTRLAAPGLNSDVGVTWTGTQLLAIDDSATARTLDLDRGVWDAADGPPLPPGEFTPQIASASGQTILSLFGGVAVLADGGWTDISEGIDPSPGYYVPFGAGDAIVLLTFSSHAPDSPAPGIAWLTHEPGGGSGSS
jgi:hypothetical protein